MINQRFDIYIFIYCNVNFFLASQIILVPTCRENPTAINHLSLSEKKKTNEMTNHTIKKNIKGEGENDEDNEIS